MRDGCCILNFTEKIRRLMNPREDHTSVPTNAQFPSTSSTTQPTSEPERLTDIHSDMKIAPEAPKINLGPSGHAILKAYLSLLLIGGNVGLPLALGTMFVSRTASRRYPTLINMLVSWIVFATASLLLLYSGEYQSRQPDFGLCLAQASLVYSGTVMVATATMCLVLQLWFEIRGRSVTHLSSGFKLLLVLAPWLSFILVLTSVAIYGSIDKSKVSYRWLFYCTISSDVIIYAVAGSSLLLLATVFCFEVSILRILYRASRQIRTVDRSAYFMSLRVSAFAACTLITFFMVGVNQIIPTLIFPYLFTSILPLTAFAVFGTTQDNIAVWTRCFSRRRRRQHYNNAIITLEPIAFRSNRVDGTSQGTTTSIQDSIKAAPSKNPQSSSTIKLAPLGDSV